MRTVFNYILLSCVFGLFVVESAFCDNPYLNLVESFADTKSILESGQQANIVVFGDSHSAKSNSSYLPYFTEQMQDYYGDGGGGYQGFSRWTGASMNYGWRGTGINMDVSPHHSLDGLWDESSLGPYSLSGLHSSAMFTARSSNIEMHYLSQPGGGTFDILRSGDKALLATIDTRSVEEQVDVWSYMFDAQEVDKQLIFQPRGDGLVTILGQNNIETDSGVVIHRAANGGWGVDNFLQRDGTFDEQLGLLDADLMMVMIGTNDAAYSEEQYKPRLHELIDRLEAGAPQAEIVLMSSYNVGPTTLGRRVRAMRQVATERGVGFIDNYESAGNCTYMRMNGYVSIDEVHLTDEGGRYIGEHLFNAFISDGESLQEVPCIAGDVNCDGVVGLMDLDIISEKFFDELNPICIDGDVNCDGEVGLVDLDVIGSNFSKQVSERSEGDLNGDQLVSLIDLDILGEYFGDSLTGSEPGEPLYGDVNCDGKVNLADLDIVGANYGRTRMVPEPSVIVLLVVGVGVCSGRRV